MWSRVCGQGLGVFEIFENFVLERVQINDKRALRPDSLKYCTRDCSAYLKTRFKYFFLPESDAGKTLFVLMNLVFIDFHFLSVTYGRDCSFASKRYIQFPSLVQTLFANFWEKICFGLRKELKFSDQKHDSQVYWPTYFLC